MRVTDKIWHQDDNGTLTQSTIVYEYGPEDARWGKYDSGFHAYLVERCEADDWTGDPDWGGVVKYGRRIDMWNSQGFHTLLTCETEEEAQKTLDEAINEYSLYCGDEDEPEEDVIECEIHPGHAHKMASLACEMLSQENYYGTE